MVTIHNMRARGMTWMRIPLFVWAILTYAWLLVLVLLTLSAGLTMMLLDRQAGTNFFNPAEGGSPILYQHVFWSSATRKLQHDPAGDGSSESSPSSPKLIFG